MSRLKRNLGYQTAYQLLNTCLPLITSPYLSRFLGAEMIGVYTYVSSICGYFVLFSMLGIVNYGTRCIAEVQNSEKDRSRLFGEIYTVQLLSSVLFTLFYAGFLLLYHGEQSQIFLIQGISLLACLLNINWFFFGIENFRFIVIRNAIIRVISVILIVLLVKKPADVWIYALIMVGGPFLNDAILWPRLRRNIRFFRLSWKAVKRHLWPIMLLFFPLLALSVYHLMDKTMLGILSPFEQSGFYNNADKLINIPIGVLTGIGAVILPRISALLTEKREKEATSMLLLSLEGIIAAACAIAFGISAISPEFVPVFFGPGYDPCVLLTIILAPVLLFKSISLIVRNGYLIPKYYDKQYIFSVIFGAVINLVVNILLIPSYGAVGATIGTLVAEAAACVWQLVFVGKKLPVWKTLVKSGFYLLFGCLMFGCVRLIGHSSSLSPIPTILLEILTGVVCYVLLCFVFWKLSGSAVFSMLISGRRQRKL